MIMCHKNRMVGTKGIIIKFKLSDRYDCSSYNYKHFRVADEKVDFKTEIRMIKVLHSELPFRPEAQDYEEYWVEQARVKFPWLFVDTSPLLYRRFYHRASWTKQRTVYPATGVYGHPLHIDVYK